MFKTRSVFFLFAVASAITLLAGCNSTSGIGAPPGPVAPPPLPVRPAQLVVSDNGADAIFMFPLGTGGNIFPSNTITSSSMSCPNRIAADSRGNLFVADSCNNAILIFDETASGHVPPTAFISSTCSAGAQVGVALTPDGSSVYGSCFGAAGTVNLFGPLGTSGSIGTTSSIGGALTHLRYPNGIAVDSSGNLWVVDNNIGGAFNSGHPFIAEFSAGSNGNVAPINTMTNLVAGFPTTMTFDASGNLYLTNSCCVAPSNTVNYWTAAHASGATAPDKIWTNASFSSPNGVIVDSSFVYQGNIGTLGHSVCWFPKTAASGAVVLTGCVKGANTGLNAPYGLTF